MLPTHARGYAGCCAAIRDMDRSAMLELLSTPTLVMGGSQDPATPPPHAEFLADHVSGATLEMLEAAQLSNIEQHDRFPEAALDHRTS